MNEEGWLRLALAVLVVLFVSNPVLAGAPSVTIDSVGGKKIKSGVVQGTLNGKVLVQGSAIPGTPDEPAPPARPLVADAGDSSFVAVGAPITLLGSGYGGAEPYTFAWSTTAGTLEGADAPTAQVNTAGSLPVPTVRR